MSRVAEGIGWVVLGGAGFVLVVVALSVLNMVVVLAATWRMRNPNSSFPHRPLRAPRWIWKCRWNRTLGFTLGGLRSLSDYRLYSTSMGLGSYLACDDVGGREREVGS